VLHVVTGRAGEAFGCGPGIAGDVDGDGLADLLVGAARSGEGRPQAGKTYVISGGKHQVLRTLTGAFLGERFGFAATGLGDVDGDGTPDFLITSPGSDAAGVNAGRAWVISGAALAD
jgi:hypothetical protein